MRDFRKLNSDPPPGVNASPNSDNVLRWNAIIFGPDGTPWEGGETILAPASNSKANPLITIYQVHLASLWSSQVGACSDELLTRPCA